MIDILVGICVAISGLLALLSFTGKKHYIIVLIAAFLVRLIASYSNVYIVQLPDAGGDAKIYHELAIQLSSAGALALIDSFPSPNSYFISWWVGFLYSIFDVNLFLAQNIGIVFAVSSILVTMKIAEKILIRKFQLLLDT